MMKKKKNQEEEDPEEEEEEENTKEVKAGYNGIFDRTTRNPKPWLHGTTVVHFRCKEAVWVGCRDAMTLKSGIVIGDLH